MGIITKPKAPVQMVAPIKVRLIKDWRQYKTGFVLEVSRGVADVLVNRRRPPLAEFVLEDEPHGKVKEHMTPLKGKHA